MTKLKLDHTSNVPSLDLSDEETMSALINADVLKPVQDKEAEATEHAIKELKSAKVTLTLSGAENAQLERMAAIKSQSVKDFIHTKIQELFIDANVGQPLISAPSKLSGSNVSSKKITAPTFLRSN